MITPRKMHNPVLSGTFKVDCKWEENEDSQRESTSGSEEGGSQDEEGSQEEESEHASHAEAPPPPEPEERNLGREIEPIYEKLRAPCAQLRTPYEKSRPLHAKAKAPEG